jgi:hypothetical protein
MSASGDPQATQTSFELEEHMYMVLWGRVSPEGPSCFRGTSAPVCRRPATGRLPPELERVKTQYQTDLENGVFNRGGRGARSPVDTITWGPGPSQP